MIQIQKGMIFQDRARGDFFQIVSETPNDEDKWDIDSSDTLDFPSDGGSDGWIDHAVLLDLLEQGTVVLSRILQDERTTIPLTDLTGKTVKGVEVEDGWIVVAFTDGTTLYAGDDPTAYGSKS